ncbi:uncharacterized protein LOC122379469 [Amphibalanus amphitrite]|uniref:uncharacterized protein LOC122379469 n=1 Tax=Amphibalanus amphitrite TaxID=1232801 RepID=UPI001C8FF1FA|nr:uncharacterized protein LOC122379469 [Amphibalanus amphitrite]
MGGATSHGTRSCVDVGCGPGIEGHRASILRSIKSIAMAVLIRLSLGIGAVLLAIAGSQAGPSKRVLSQTRMDVTINNAPFVTDEVVDSFEMLHVRQCEPEGFDWTKEGHQELKEILEGCESKVKAGGLGADCDGVEFSALYFLCIANSVGELDAAGTSFDLDAFQDKTDGYSDDPKWSITEEDMFTHCIRRSTADLTPRQQAVYAYACMKWCFAVSCDDTLIEEQRLDNEGRQRIVSFLNGHCPLSPTVIVDAFGQLTSRTWAECTDSVASISDDYDAAVGRISCLLQDFQAMDGTVDFDSLSSAINSIPGDSDLAPTLSWNLLLDVCGPSDAAASVSTVEFIECWAGYGLYSCAFMEANALARLFPSTCTVTL